MSSFVGSVAVTPVKHRQSAQQALEQIPRQSTGWLSERNDISTVSIRALESREPALSWLVLDPWENSGLILPDSYI